ncbi:MAG: hypothetical protein JRI68_05305 [Deltaproteobacteria bacterium]|nr:hypothetical protein [Deltaproteobacteria bacterium]
MHSGTGGTASSSGSGGSTSGGGGGSDCTSTTSLDHCGACNQPCDPQNANGATCETGSCSYGSCWAGFGDCDGDEANGCETDLGTDIDHCGECEHLCVDDLANVMGAACTNGVCDYTDCAPMFADCDGNTTNGCEEPANTMQNCGGCGVACAPQNVSGPINCNSGVCDYGSCLAPFDDCDGDANNGCEIDTSSDTAHCGGCNSPCVSPETCNGGTCGTGCFSTSDVVQQGTQPIQSTRCDSVTGGGFTCINPTITYGNVTTGVPSQHGNNNYPLWCQQLGCSGFVSVNYGNRSYTAPWGKLFWTIGYDDNNTPHWCDWQDGLWYNQTLDDHPAPDGNAIVSITCN